MFPVRLFYVGAKNFSPLHLDDQSFRAHHYPIRWLLLGKSNPPRRNNGHVVVRQQRQQAHSPKRAPDNNDNHRKSSRSSYKEQSIVDPWEGVSLPAGSGCRCCRCCCRGGSVWCYLLRLTLFMERAGMELFAPSKVILCNNQLESLFF